jgi:hypothetical protein
MLSNPSKPVTICSVAGIVGKCFSKAFTKHYIEKGFHVTGIYPLSENTLCEYESLSSYVIDRIYNQEKETGRAPSGSKDNNEEGKPAGFMKVSPEIKRPLPKDGPRKSGGRKHG